MTIAPVLLETRNLSTWFTLRGGLLRRRIGVLKAVDDITIQLHEGETLGLVGESGCGKSTLVQTIIRLQDATSGSVLLRDEHGAMQDLLRVDQHTLKSLRRRVQLVFQDATAAMNPRFTVRQVIEEPLRIQGIGTPAERAARVAELLESVGLKAEHATRHPHMFSGGQRQRIGIARALALNPSIIIADEPVSALDVSVQSQVLNLLKELKASHGLSYIFIAHNLDVVRYMSHRVAVMYLGRIVELGETSALYHRPRHPYTEMLLSAIPIPHPRLRATRKTTIAGDLPDPANPPAGCPFHVRCPYAQDICRRELPPLVQATPTHTVACHFHDQLNLQGRSST